MKALRSLVMFGILLSLSTAMVVSVEAQEKKDTKKDDTKKDDTKKTDTKKSDAKDTPKKMGVGSIEIYKAKDGFRYRIKDADDKVIAMPPKAFETAEDAQNILDFLKETLTKGKTKVIKD